MPEPDEQDLPSITRRNLFGGMALAVLMPQPLSAAQVEAKLAALDPMALHHLLRGLVFLDRFGDPVVEDDAAALLEHIERRLPGASMLVELYRAYHHDGFAPFQRAEERGNLAILHRAVAEARPVACHYTDLNGQATDRTVLPLALVHPPHGIQLLAWCELRGDYRKFFVDMMQDTVLQEPCFADRRFDLLCGLLEREELAV